MPTGVKQPGAVHQGLQQQPGEEKEQPTGVTDAAAYAGIVYYEEKGVEDVMTFTAAKKLNALLEVSY